MKAVDNIRIRRRTTLIGVVFGLLLAGIGAKAVHVQIVHGTWLSDKALGQYQKSFKTVGQRGSIFDAQGRELAVSINLASIAAYPARIKDKAATAAALAGILKMNRRQLAARLNRKNKPFIWLKRHVNPAKAEKVRKLAIEGLDFIPEHSRAYPHRSVAAQVIGFAGIDGRGLEGVEYLYNDRLKGDQGKYKIFKDALGRRFEDPSGQGRSIRGHNLYLTIDRTIQYNVEKVLLQAISRYKARSAMGIVMVPQTGAILAMANVPLFNPNNHNQSPSWHWRNRTVADRFEPGSTMKIFSIAAALEAGAFRANTRLYCENGEYAIGRNIVHDTKPHKWLTVTDIVRLSSNIGAVKVGEKIGSERLYATLKEFGFGTRTGVNCPGETTGRLSPYKRWSKIDAGAISFGQGLSVSALQLATATGAIANGGTLMRPYIVARVTDARGREIKAYGPQPVRRVVSPDTAAIVGRMMQTVVDDGTGTLAALAEYQVSGKTGTAQKAGDSGSYDDKKFIASFTGFVPSENPKLVILVVVDEPEENHYGGTVAGPAFRKIAETSLDYLNIAPKQKSEGLIVSRESEATG
ncbi:MAG: penicillin-binding protein 2 [Desulfobacterales bacterium]|nr:penicillin-binding protein 2 [Desulfobacterales bacterium]